ncbi:hypothetical protein BOTBODRAFT_80673, partial [Botryobasidium botryosum FD-172 SS1]
MPPSEFAVRLQHGISGGFAPPNPSAIYSLARQSNNPSKIFIQSQIRPDGTPTLQDPKNKELDIGHASTSELIDELEGILKKLPQFPPGSADAYGLDTGIFWQSDNLQWMNSGPQGCGGGFGGEEVTKEQKEQFKRAVDIINEL